jgi:molybdenum-dependent DNA-binding transcriptional regulator ModE
MSSVRQNVIKHKVSLLSLAAEFGNVSRASKVMGLSRDPAIFRMRKTQAWMEERIHENS